MNPRRIVFVLAAGAAVASPTVPAAGGGGCHEPSTERSGTDVEMKGMCMTPAVLRVEPGTTVTWTNRDPLAHNLHATQWGAGDLAPDATFTQTFAEPGTYAYACTLHPGMVGAVVVGDQPVPIAAVSPSSDDSGAGTPLAIGLVGVAALVGAFAAGVRTARRT
jgi:plastocyanin